jgi:diguanylate cyclase (GGDEF)-like protein
MQSSERESTKRILVVEDDAAATRILVESLGLAGYQVDQAESAEEAMNKIRTFKPHLVLTDHDMPGLSGLEMLQQLRAAQNYVTVIFVSGRSETSKVVSVLRTGADDYIRKPYDVQEMLARVEASLRNNDLHRELYEANLRLNEMVEVDFLTGLLNMRSMYDRIDHAIKVCPEGRSVACVMLDMDKFKRVNDDHDHLFGSYVLKEVGRLIREKLSAADYGARYGGDEFLVVLTACDEGGVKKFCDHLRGAVEATTFREGAHSIRLTISLGYALSASHPQADARRLVRAADENLYRAKEAGRNRAVGS